MEAKQFKSLVRALREKMKQDCRWAARGLVAVFQNQTYDEQTSHTTRYLNGVGFNGLDAAFGSSMAEQAMVWFATPKDKRACPEPLSLKQGIYAKKMAVKYATQVAGFMVSAHPEVAAQILGEVLSEAA